MKQISTLLVLNCLLISAFTNLLPTPRELGFSPNEDNLCGGYYFEKPIFKRSDSLIKVSADEIEATQQAKAYLKGNITIEFQDYRASAQEAWVTKKADQKKIDTVTLKGNVMLANPGKQLSGSEGTLAFHPDRAKIKHARYRVHLGSNRQACLEGERYMGHVAWGNAKSIEEIDAKVYHLEKMSLSTCPPHLYNWHLESQQLTLNENTQRGHAKHAYFYIKNTPVFYLPYFSFPLNDKRQSGFLTPSYGLSRTLGHDILLPYYLSLAPNYDATFTPRLLSKRGLLFASEGRYLFEKHAGEVRFAIMPYDRQFVKQPTGFRIFKHARAHAYLKHKSQFNAKWSFETDFNWVSDDDYYIDFATANDGDFNHHQKQMAKTTFRDNHWLFEAMLLRYQSLNPARGIPNVQTYQSLPTVVLDMNYPGFWQNIAWTWKNEASHFVWPKQNNSPTPATLYQTINRLYSEPSVSFLWDKTFGYVEPKVALNQRNYQLTHGPARDKALSKTIPIFTIDSGLKFERLVFNPVFSYRQTLKPRMMYAYIPYRNQTDIPIINSGYASITYHQLFEPNRFTGHDRVGDTHHLAFGLLSEFQHQESKVDWLKLGIGQTVYFKNRRVTLLAPNVLSESKFLGYTPLTESLSPLVAYAHFIPNTKWSVQANIAWHLKQKQLYSSHLKFLYTPKTNHIYSIDYAFIRNGDSLIPQLIPTTNTQNLSQLKGSFSVPINTRWKGYASVSYNFNQHYVRNMFAGIEYEHCCWAIRLLGGRHFIYVDNTNKPRFNQQVYIQIRLKGFGSYQQNDVDALLQEIPGWTDTFKER
jgi:LPS-assembly protein